VQVEDVPLHEQRCLAIEGQQVRDGSCSSIENLYVRVATIPFTRFSVWLTKGGLRVKPPIIGMNKFVIKALVIGRGHRIEIAVSSWK
jgi:hypothetical protein